MNLASITDIQEAELKLRESQIFSEKISETTPGLVAVWNLVDGNYEYVNRSVKSILGYEPSDFIEGGIQFVSSLVHPDDVVEIMALNTEAVQEANANPIYDDSTIHEFEYRMRHKLGHYVWLHTYGVIFSRTTSNEVERILNISVDITERRKNEEELRSTKEALQRLNDELEQKVRERTHELELEKVALRKQTERNNLVDKATNDVIWDVDLIANKISYNDNYQLLFGYNISRKLINSDTWMDRIHPEDKTRVLTGIDRLMASKVQQWTDEYRFMRHDGTYANILDRGYILYNESGTPYRMVGCMTDVTQLKAAEAKAKTSETKFRRIYESNIIGMVFSTLDGKFIDANEAFLEMLGYTREELQLGLVNSNVITPVDYKPHSEKSRHQLRETGICQPFEEEYIHKKGHRITALVGAAMLNDADQELAVTYLIDITKSKEAIQIIKDNEDKFRFLADAIPQKVWTADPDGKINYMNKVWLDYTGISSPELINNIEITHPDDKEKTVLAWQNAMRTGETFELEHRYRRSDGAYRWHLSRGVAQRDSNGNIIMWVGTDTDIHDQKTFAEALRISEDYFRELSDNVPFVIWKVDNTGRATYVNRSWVDFTGRSFEDSLGYGWAESLHPDERQREAESFMAAFARRVPYTSKFRLRRQDGEYRYMLGQSTPLFNPDFIGYIGSLTDITEQELAQQATELLMHQKDEFMSIASHELKTPITSMKAYLQLVERMSSKDEKLFTIHSFIEKANKQVNKLTSLVEDLLDVTKIHAGKMVFNKTYFKIGEVVEECLDEVQNNANHHTIEVNGNLELPVYADKYRIEQVLTNFLSNAIKYSPDADLIIINIDDEQEYVKVSVRDFGIGIPENKMNFVFDRFFRVQESSEKFSGLGLGLYISSEIISRHGGKIGLESKEDDGTTFWFRIPKEEN
jgi:PAS domain S-box-containing protein